MSQDSDVEMTVTFMVRKKEKETDLNGMMVYNGDRDVMFGGGTCFQFKSEFTQQTWMHLF